MLPATAALRLSISPAMSIPMGIIYLVLPLAGVLIIFYSIVFMTETLSASQDESGTKQTGT